MPNSDKDTMETMSKERYQELVSLHKELGKELEDLKNRAAAILRKTQTVLDKAETKKVLQHILDNT